MKKEAIWSDMPVGDPGLPGQLTQQDIIGGPEEDMVFDQQGETEIAGGTLFYKYDYDYNMGKAINIKPLAEWQESLIEENEEQIRRDIEMFQEDEKLKRQPDYGEPEFEPDDIGF